MQLRQLRRILQQVVLAGLPASVGCATDASEPRCHKPAEHTFSLATPAEPALQFRIDGCRVDVDACDALCELAFERGGIDDERFGGITSCSVEFRGTAVAVKVGYNAIVDQYLCPVDGRRPPFLAPPQARAAATAAGGWLAHAAWLEAASVHAFVRLADELGLHGAPRSLIGRARAAVGDEVRHAEAMTRLAVRYGARPALPVVAPPVARSLEALAIENITEGCVRETWGAVVALWQSHTAGDPAVRATFAAIAPDEIRHAELAWAVDRWIAPRLDAAARARVAVARRAASHELLESDSAKPLPALGLPGGSDLRDLAKRAHSSLWENDHSCHA